jgi:hypothetical protein
MKKVFLSLLLFLLLPSLCSAAYIIHLKNGSKLKTTSYWKEGQTVKFLYRGGEIGLDKSLILSIEHTEQVVGDGEPTPEAAQPEKQVELEPPAEKAAKDDGDLKKKKSSTERRKIKTLQKRFSYLQGQFKKIKTMSRRKAISLTQKLMNFRDVVLKEGFAAEFEKEVLEVYAMADAIEAELNSRN